MQILRGERKNSINPNPHQHRDAPAPDLRSHRKPPILTRGKSCLEHSKVVRKRHKKVAGTMYRLFLLPVLLPDVGVFFASGRNISCPSEGPPIASIPLPSYPVCAKS